MGDGVHRAYVALGSNLGWQGLPPEGVLKAAVGTMVARVGALEAASSLYRTAPVGFHAQPAFVNAVVALRSPLGPEALMRELLAIERQFGRVRDRANGPRTLDLDLLLLDDLVMESHGLVLPHPRMAGRRFVLEPLAEIAPEMKHPLLGRSMKALLRELPATGEQRPEGVRRLGAIVEACY